MDFDPNPSTGERNRSGPRWYSVVAFLVIAFLLAVNALAMFANAEANEEQACYTHSLAEAQYIALGLESTRYYTQDQVTSFLSWMHEACSAEHSWGG